MADWPFWDKAVSKLVYIRLYGHVYTYASSCSGAELLVWAHKIHQWLGAGFDICVYFYNDAEGAAPLNAAQLKRLLALG